MGACGSSITFGRGKTVKVTSEWRLYILGTTLLVALSICARNFGDRGGPHFMASLTLGAVAYLLAVGELFAIRGP